MRCTVVLYFQKGLKMGKTSQPAWVKRILKLLEQAKSKDSDQEVFGAGSHQYKLSAPASEDRVRKFEDQYGIRLPEECRNFLMLIGNGGAGPYYGIYGLEELAGLCCFIASGS